MSTEPQPGARLSAEDFGAIVRLTPLVSIDLLVRNARGQLLLGKRVNEPARNSYFVPGGRITKNETRAAAFRRLCQVELGLNATLDQARPLGTFDHIYATNALEEPGYGTHYVVLAYEIRVGDESELSLPKDQHGEYLWATDHEILERTDVHENTKAYAR